MRCQRRLIFAGVMCLLLSGSAIMFTQTQGSQTYQTGSIMEVKVHQPAAETENGDKQYDISVKVGKTLYVVLYTAPSGSNAVEYRAGMDLPVSIQGDTMKFSDLLGRTQSVPILSRKPVESKKPKEASAKTQN